MPRSRSKSMLSRIWSSISRAETALHFSRSRSASVDLPWSMCAMMEKISDVLFVHSCCSCLLSARRRRAPNGASGVLPSGKTLPQGEFISPEDVQSKGFPQGLQPLWENDFAVVKGSPKSQRLLGERKGSGVSELWLLSLSEGYGTCLDERDDGEISEILISCRAGNSSFLRCCGVPASRSA